MKKRYVSPQSYAVDFIPSCSILELSIGINNTPHPGIIGEAPRRKEIIDDTEDENGEDNEEKDEW